ELSASALQTINELWGEGVSDDGNNTISIFMNPPSKDEEFSGIEFMIPFMAAVLNSEMHADETASQIFASNNRTVFGMLSSEKKDKKNVWINYYAKFFPDLKNAGHTEAFSYYIQKSGSDEEVGAWLTEHEREVENMLSWVAGYHE
ncbi:MAG: hypothetical protein H7X71_03745, partial [Chitinophagales bacterium]|nr:hypothetical protein [Chitinophagales bacterium]